jgi:hypothetical protein
MGSGLRLGVVACALLPLLAARERLAFGQDVAAAEDLYNRGVADFRAGHYEAACAEIGASYRMDPLPGALFTLATCEARLGRVASAVAHFQDFVQLVPTLPADQQALQAERRQVAVRERAALLPDVPTLRVQIAGRLPLGATVRRDLAALDAALLGADLPVDPGEHVVAIEVGHATVRQQKVVVVKGEHRTVSLEAPPPPEPAVERPSRSTQPPPPDRPVSHATSSGSGAPSTAGLIAAGFFATTGIVVGSVAGALALGEKGIVDQHCVGPACTPEGKQAADTGRTEALVSTIAFGVGAAGVAAIAVLLFAGRTAPRTATSVVVTTGGVGVRF